MSNHGVPIINLELPGEAEGYYDWARSVLPTKLVSLRKQLVNSIDRSRRIHGSPYDRADRLRKDLLRDMGIPGAIPMGGARGFQKKAVRDQISTLTDDFLQQPENYAALDALFVNPVVASASDVSALRAGEEVSGESVEGGAPDASSFVEFPAGTSPASVVLAIMKTHMEDLTRKDVRYILDIEGSVDGVYRRVARSLNANNPENIYKLVTASISGQYNGIVFGSDVAKEDETRSDPALYDLQNLKVDRIKVIRVPSGASYNTDRQASSEAFHAGGPNTAGGSFCHYWLNEEFPEDLSCIQVFKASQQKELFKQEVFDGEKFEIGCLANSMRMQGMGSDQIIRLMELFSDGNFQPFPSSKLGELSETLKINIAFTTYDETHRSRGRSSKEYMGAGLNDKWYAIGKIENHYIPDVESGWSKTALHQFEKVYEALGKEAYEKLTLKEKRLLTKVNRNRASGRISLISDGRPVFATFGEMMTILIYGIDGNFNSEGKITKKRGHFQKKLVTVMEAEDFCMKAELYTLFKEEFTERDLPTFKSEEEMDKWIAESSKPMAKTRYNVMKGGDLPIDNSPSNYRGPRAGYAAYEAQKKRERENELYNIHGAQLETEWKFHDKYVTEGSYRPVLPPPLPEPKPVPFDIPEWYTVIAMDSETVTCETVIPAKGNIKERTIKLHKPYMFEGSYYEYADGKPVNYRDVDRIMKAYSKKTHLVGAYAKLNFTDYLLDKLGNGAHIKTVSFWGPQCAQLMLNFFASEKFREYHLHVISHNAHYDINMLLADTDGVIESGIIKSASKLNTAVIKSGGKLSHHQCTLAVTGIPLRDFASTFNLKVCKEYMPYDAYTMASLYYPDGSPNVNATAYMDEVWKMTSASSLEEFRSSVLSSGQQEAAITGKVNLWKYADYYCRQDCVVLLTGFLNLREELYSLLVPELEKDESMWKRCELDIIRACSLPQYATHYLGRCGVFDGCYQFRGSIREFLARAVVGGKCMIGANVPHMITKFMDDFDACSLYPAAMKRIADEGGFSVGTPKFWNPSEPTSVFPKELEGVHQYFVSVKVYAVGKALDLPLLSVKDGKSTTRHFTNQFPVNGQRMVLDKIGLEDAWEHHEGLKMEFCQALYFTNGGNKMIGPVMDYLYQSRLQLKADSKKEGAGNSGAAQQARKLVMNAAYGRLIMRPIDKEHKFIEGEKEILHYIARHSITRGVASYLRPDFAIVERKKSVFEHYALPHLGAHVLSMSKRIMNEVTTTAQNCGLMIHYMDTDSLHIARDDVPTLSKAFFERFGRKLVVTPGEETQYTSATEALGLFHSDFAAPDKKKKYTVPAAVTSVFVGKKCYYDRLMVWEKSIPEDERTDDNAIFYDHVRMKGVPTQCIANYAEKNGLTMTEIFENLLKGESYEIDLTDGAICWKSTKSFETYTQTKFSRTVQIGKEALAIARAEWGADGRNYAYFPYDWSFPTPPTQPLPPPENTPMVVEAPPTTEEVLSSYVSIDDIFGETPLDLAAFERMDEIDGWELSGLMDEAGCGLPMEDLESDSFLNNF